MYQGFLSYKQVAFTVLWHTSICLYDSLIEMRFAGSIDVWMCLCAW